MSESKKLNAEELKELIAQIHKAEENYKLQVSDEDKAEAEVAWNQLLEKYVEEVKA